jgi:hypothetical protein
MTVPYVDTGTKYVYPDSHVQRSLSWYNGAAVLAKGIIYKLDSSGNSNVKYFKRFQFNPPAFNVGISMVSTDPPGSLQQGGNDITGANGVGNLSVSFELFFNREIEVARATNGNPLGVPDADPVESAKVFRKIGVQKDIYDVMRVILAGEDGTSDLALPGDMDTGAISKRVFDLSADGKMISNSPCVVIFGPDTVNTANMSFYGLINDFRITYDKFNHNLVPVQCHLTLGMDCMQQRPSNTLGVGATGATGAASTNTGDPTGGVGAPALPGQLFTPTQGTVTT